MRSISIKEQAIELRKEGYSYSHISKVTGLSKSTLSGWLGAMPYVPNEKMVELLGRARAAANKKKAEIKRLQIESIQNKASNDIGQIAERDLFMFGLGLYLGEGGKTSNIVRIVNSDPRTVKAAIKWFSILGVSPEQFSVRVHLYPDSDIKKSLAFWSEVTNLPATRFSKSCIDTRSDKKSKNQGKLPHGTLHLGVKSMGKKEYGVLFFRTIQAWSDQMLQRIDERD